MLISLRVCSVRIKTAKEHGYALRRKAPIMEGLTVVRNNLPCG